MNRKFSIFFVLVSCQMMSLGQLTHENVYVDYDSIWQYKNLQVIPIRWKGDGLQGGLNDILSNTMTLNEALKKGMAKMMERGTASTENVHWLIVENSSNKNLYISSGEIFSGGRQDRMTSRDTIILAANKRTQIPVMCVEEGRWSEKEKKFVYQKQANLSLRKIIDKTPNQVLIWRNIYNQLHQNNFKSPTEAYLAPSLNKKFTAQEEEYWQFFEQKISKSDSSIIGFVCQSGNKIIGCDIFISPNLFYGQLRPMLLGYIDEAIVQGSSVTISLDDVKRYMDELLKDEASQQQFIKAKGKAYIQDGKIIHITTF